MTLWATRAGGMRDAGIANFDAEILCTSLIRLDPPLQEALALHATPYKIEVI